MNRHGALAWYRFAAVLPGLVAQPVLADQIRLKDGTQLTGTIVERDGESVVIALPRSQVVTVNDVPLPPPVAEGNKAPVFQALDLAGERWTVPDPNAGATLVKFWATWCPHCRADVSLLKKLFVRYHDQGFALVTISVDRDQKALEQFVQREQIPYPVLSAYGGGDPILAALPERYETRGIPAYFLIDGRGIITKVWSGSLTETRANIEEILTNVLGLPIRP